MIEEYLRQIDELLSTSPTVSSIEVIRRSVRDTGAEKVLNYRYRAMLVDGGLIEMSERVVERRGEIDEVNFQMYLPCESYQRKM